MASATYQQLLRRHVYFRQLWAGQVISELGSWFSFIAELGLVRMLSGSSLATTILLVSRMLPFLVVAPFAGVFADRYSRKHIMIAADLFRALAALGYLVVGTRCLYAVRFSPPLAPSSKRPRMAHCQTLSPDTNC